MFQRANAKQRQVDFSRTPTTNLEPAIGTPGKRTLTGSLPPLGAPDRYTHVVESAKRELAAARGTALPAYIRALRMSDDNALLKQVELVRSAIQVRHLLMTANQHVFALEQSMTHKDPMVLFLRASLTTLVSRASKLGVYRGAEDMKPQAFVEEKPRPMSRKSEALVAVKSTETKHQAPARAKPSTAATMKVTKKLPPAAPPPPPTKRRSTARANFTPTFR